MLERREQVIQANAWRTLIESKKGSVSDGLFKRYESAVEQVEKIRVIRGHAKCAASTLTFTHPDIADRFSFERSTLEAIDKMANEIVRTTGGALEFSSHNALNPVSEEELSEMLEGSSSMWIWTGNKEEDHLSGVVVSGSEGNYGWDTSGHIQPFEKIDGEGLLEAVNAMTIQDNLLYYRVKLYKFTQD